MAMTIEDIRGWIAVLRANPDLQAEVRREVLSEELLSLPDLVRQNGEDIRALREVVQQNTEDIRQNGEDIRALREIVQQNTEDIRQNSEDIRALREIVQQNTEDIRQNGEDIRALREIVQQNSVDIRELKDSVNRVTDAVATLAIRIDNLVNVTTRHNGVIGALDGASTEMRWKLNYSGRFGRLVRRARLREPAELDAFEEAFDSGAIDDDEAQAVRELDVIIEGERGRRPNHEHVLLAIEVSVRLEEKDLKRVLDRTAILRKVGYNAIPVLAGALIDPFLEMKAKARGVHVVLKPDDLLNPTAPL